MKIHEFNACLWSAYHVPGATPGSGDTTANNTDKSLCLHGTYMLVGGSVQYTDRQVKSKLRPGWQG